MSAPGRSEALILERAARKDSPMSAPGRSEALILERAARKDSPLSAPGRSKSAVCCHAVAPAQAGATADARSARRVAQ